MKFKIAVLVIILISFTTGIGYGYRHEKMKDTFHCVWTQSLHGPFGPYESHEEDMAFSGVEKLMERTASQEVFRMVCLPK